MNNPYPEMLEHEDWEVPDQRHQIWDEAYKAGQDSVFDSMPENLPPLLETAHRSGIKEAARRIQAKLDEWLRRVKDDRNS